MTRIFAALALADIILMLVTAAIGWSAVDDHNTDRHVLLAVLTLLLSCFVQVVVFTYFTVTGKLVGQAVHLGGLPVATMDRVKALKRGVTRRLAAAIVVIVGVTATGALRWSTGEWAWLHHILAWVLLAVFIVVLYQQLVLVMRNAALVDRTLTEYRRRRGES